MRKNSEKHNQHNKISTSKVMFCGFGIFLITIGLHRGPYKYTCIQSSWLNYLKIAKQTACQQGIVNSCSILSNIYSFWIEKGTTSIVFLQSPSPFFLFLVCDDNPFQNSNFLQIKEALSISSYVSNFQQQFLSYGFGRVKT